MTTGDQLFSEQYQPGEQFVFIESVETDGKQWDGVSWPSWLLRSTYIARLPKTKEKSLKRRFIWNHAYLSCLELGSTVLLEKNTVLTSIQSDGMLYPSKIKGEEVWPQSAQNPWQSYVSQRLKASLHNIATSAHRAAACNQIRELPTLDKYRNIRCTTNTEAEKRMRKNRRYDCN